jgi:hypothetical protein
VKGFAALGTALSGILVGLGIAIVAKTVHQVGLHRFVLGDVVGPGLVLVGLLRWKLQRALERGQEGEDGDPS